MMEHIAGRSMPERMKGAALLDVATYEEVEADDSATVQAAGVVLIVAIAQAIGAIGTGNVLGAAIASILGWLIWSGVTYLIGSRVFGGTATWGELLRTIGFAQAPGVLLVLAAIPLLGWLIRFIVAIWMLIAVIIAIRQALDFSTGKAIGTALLGWIAMLVLASVLGGLGGSLPF
jgi:hypothetical protein